MTLDNLVKISELTKTDTSTEEIENLFKVADRWTMDAKAESISDDARVK